MAAIEVVGPDGPTAEVIAVMAAVGRDVVMVLRQGVDAVAIADLALKVYKVAAISVATSKDTSIFVLYLNYFFFGSCLNFLVSVINSAYVSFDSTVVVGLYAYAIGRTISTKRRKEDYL